jgi:hypothetical protein
VASRGSITVKIDGEYNDKDINKAIRDLNRLKTDAGGAKGPMDGLSTAFKGLAAGAAAAFSIATVTDFIRDAATAAMQDEKSMVALATAMDNVGQGFANAGTEDFIKQLMLATGVADDSLRPAMQRLVTATGDAAESQDLLQTALDISAATGKDVVQVSQALARASTGQVSALTRLGVPLDANIVKTRDFGAAVDSLNERFGGQAAAAADTYAGQMARVQTAADEAQETIGYALLDAVESASDAFGGAGGMVEGITAAGEKAADLVAGLGLAVTALGDLKMAADDVELGVGGATMSLGDLAKQVVLSFPGVRMQAEAFNFLTEAGSETRASQDAINTSLQASESLYAGYIASLDGSAVAQRGVEIAADDAAAALDDMKASFDAVTGAMSTQDKMDAYRLAVLRIKDSIDDTSRSLGANSEAGLKNRDTIRDVFQQAQDAAVAWGEQNGKTTGEVQQRFATMTTNIRQKLIDQGFKPEDIDKFLGGLGLWTTQTQTLASGLSNGQAAAAMRSTGQAFADNTSDGFEASMRPGGRAFNAMSSRMTALAESLRRETTITVTTVNRSTYESQVPAAARRAKGGPVSANDVYLVGERGPELFVSDSAGTIVPNHDLMSPSLSGSGGGGGNTYSITVQAGVGDPRQIGQQVVEYIKRFEQANGNVFAAA